MRDGMAPLVSVIIPCYNAGPMLNCCLASCFAQTYPNIEIIFVDNNSTDDSVSRAEQLARGQKIPLAVLRCPEQGVASARNRGFESARGDYIQWLDADDELSPDKIARQVAALESSADADIAYCDWEWCFFANGELAGRVPFAVRQYDDFLLQILANDWFPPHAYFLRRQAADRLNALGAWRQEAGSIEDRVYYTLAAIIGLRFLYAEGCSARYNRWSDSQVTAKYNPANRSRERALSFAWLRLHAEKQPKSRFSADHRWLLEQDWRSFRAAEKSFDDLSFSERNVFQIVAKRKESHPLELCAAVRNPWDMARPHRSSRPWQSRTGQNAGDDAPVFVDAARTENRGSEGGDVLPLIAIPHRLADSHARTIDGASPAGPARGKGVFGTGFGIEPRRSKSRPAGWRAILRKPR